MAVNTSMIALGVLFAPVTALFGPVVTWNVLARLALALSAFSMCMALRRWTQWWPAAFVGGLVYGYSAYALSNLHHLFLYFVPLPPVMLLLLYEILVRQRWHPARTGALLGAMCGVQYLISSEILVSTIVIGAIATALHLIACRKHIGPKWPYIKTSSAFALVVGAVLLVYPVGFALLGPSYIAGSPQSPQNLAQFHGGLLSPFVPALQVYRSFVQRLAENGAAMYLGIPLIAALVGTTVWLRRQGLVVLAGTMVAVSLILSLGSSLHVGAHNTGVPLPFTVLGHLPFFDGLIPDRFGLFASLFGGSVLAIGMNELYFLMLNARRPSWRSLRWQKTGAGLVTLGIAVVVLFPLIPQTSEQSIPTPVSPFFASSAAKSIPLGSTVLAYPYPQAWQAGPNSSQSVDDVLLDQAVSGMGFKVIGGYGWRPLGTYGTPEPSRLAPPSVEALFNAAFFASAPATQLGLLERSNLVADLRRFMRTYDVGTVIVLPSGRHPGIVIAQLTAAIGRPIHSGGAAVWFHVQRRLSTT